MMPMGNIQTFDFPQDAGLDASITSPRPFIFAHSQMPVVNYTLSACIYSPLAPDPPIACAATFGFNAHTSPQEIAPPALPRGLIADRQ
jgi:hypothetical protein